jgi:hypothetical protein
MKSIHIIIESSLTKVILLYYQKKPFIQKNNQTNGLWNVIEWWYSIFFLLKWF